MSRYLLELAGIKLLAKVKPRKEPRLRLERFDSCAQASEVTPDQIERVISDNQEMWETIERAIDSGSTRDLKVLVAKLEARKSSS